VLRALAARRPPRDRRQRRVEPDDDVRALEAELAEPAEVVAVGDPAVALERLEHARAEDLAVDLPPARLPEERVQLDVRDAEPPCELAGEDALVRARGADDGDLARYGSVSIWARWSRPE
jgi:hypothetical protein